MAVTELTPFDKALLASRGNATPLDAMMEQELRANKRPKRRYLPMLGQGTSTKRPVIPEGNPQDPNAGVLWRFAPIRFPGEAPSPKLSNELACYFYRAYVHWLTVENEEGQEMPLRTICCGDIDAMRKSGDRYPLDTENCPSCAYTKLWLDERGIDAETWDFKTPGLPAYRRYWLGFNESAYESDLQAWLEIGREEGETRDPAAFRPPLWGLEVTTKGLFELISDQNRDPQWGPLWKYRVRLYRVPSTGRGDWVYKLVPVMEDIMNEHRYRPFTSAQQETLHLFNHGVEEEGVWVPKPDVSYDLCSWDPEIQKRAIYRGREGQERRENKATQAFADNPVRPVAPRAHAPVPASAELPFVPNTPPAPPSAPPSPVRAGRAPASVPNDIAF